MSFRDLFPDKFKEPTESRHQTISPAAVPSADPVWVPIVGQAGMFRMAWLSMAIPDFPDAVDLGGVRVCQVSGPIWTQDTTVSQKPGWRTLYSKAMRRGPVEVGEGFVLTVAEYRVTLPEEGLLDAMQDWRDRVLGAVALLAAMMDERIAMQELAEDLIILGDNGEPIGVADSKRRLRRFPTASRLLSQQREQLEGLDLFHADDNLATAARWYLRAAQSGPTADAIVFLWIALETLSKPETKKEAKKRTDVGWVREALSQTGFDEEDLPVSLGRLADLRAQVVHFGREQPNHLREGYYSLEIVARVLLRHRAGMKYGWPISPGASQLRGPLGTLGNYFAKFSTTEWVE